MGKNKSRKTLMGACTWTQLREPTARIDAAEADEADEAAEADPVATFVSAFPVSAGVRMYSRQDVVERERDPSSC
jgi:hypothetical protein